MASDVMEDSMKLDVALAPYDAPTHPLPPRIRTRLNAILHREFHILDTGLLVQDTSSAILAYVNDGGRIALAGFVVYSQQVGDADDAYIDWMLTLPKYRRRGVASSILRHMKMAQAFPRTAAATTTTSADGADAARSPSISLHVDGDDAGAQALYCGLGFRFTGEHSKTAERDDGTMATMREMCWRHEAAEQPTHAYPREDNVW